MLGGSPTKNSDGHPVEGNGQALTKSAYQPSQAVKDLFAYFQRDYQNAWVLQRKPLDEFDGYSLLDRTRLDQETFGAFVGVEFIAKQKRWRFRGRKNTARNKLISILAHLIAGMLFPVVNAQNSQDEEDKVTAKAMNILIEEHLKKAGYEVKFMYFVLSMLVNPAVFVEVDYATVLQRVKQRLANGKVKIIQAVDELLSGLNLHTIPIDELVLGDLYSGTGNIHSQPSIFRVRRISYDEARGKYAGKYQIDGKDAFDFVHAGKTRWIEDNTQGNEALYDVDWTEADGNFVQEITGYWRSEDLQVTFVGGVFMGNQENPFNTNPFEHRRLQLINGEWLSVPVYKFAMSGFEPIDPSGRFAYYKSAAFKEYWDDQKINTIDRMLVDGVSLDVMKPIFVSGVTNMNSTVIAPGAVTSMPLNAKTDAYSLSPNLAAAAKVIADGTQDMSESTQDKVMQGTTEAGVTATQSVIAQRQAKLFLGVAGLGLANLITQIGKLAIDCVVQHTTIGELDASAPESLRMKFRTILAKGKEGGKNITNKMVFTDQFMGRKVSDEEIKRKEWELYETAKGIKRDKDGRVIDKGRDESDQFIYEMNPYKFARSMYSIFVDADKIVKRSMGQDKLEKREAFEMLTDPRVMPFTDPQAVAEDFVIEEYADGDPEKYKSKKGQEEIMESLMGMTGDSDRSKPAKGIEQQVENKI